MFKFVQLALFYKKYPGSHHVIARVRAVLKKVLGGSRAYQQVMPVPIRSFSPMNSDSKEVHFTITQVVLLIGVVELSLS